MNLSKELEDFKKMHFAQIKKFSDEISSGKSAMIQNDLIKLQNELLEQQVKDMNSVLTDREKTAASKPHSVHEVASL